MITPSINGTRQLLDADPDIPLLRAFRGPPGLTGTLYGCGRALCGVSPCTSMAVRCAPA